LLDGRNRLDALETIGLPVINANGRLNPISVGYQNIEDKVDPYGYVKSGNIHHRHLTNEQRRELIVEPLKAGPTKSNRQIAAVTKADHKTVVAEGRGENSTAKSRNPFRAARLSRSAFGAGLPHLH
jgi:hypothetical protein